MKLILGIESSCDETGVALYHTERGLLAHALHSQIAMHNEYGGVVPELASRDHVRHVLPLIRDSRRTGQLPAKRHRRYCLHTRTRPVRRIAGRRERCLFTGLCT